MRPQSIYRIYTEQKNKDAIVDLLASQFESFTLQPTLGYYRKEPEKSIVIQIVGAKASAIRRLAEGIRKMNGQKSILILKSDARTETHRG